MTRTTKISLAVIGALVLALVGGYLGAGFRGSDSASAASAGVGNWMKDVEDRGELRVGVAIAPPMTVEQDGKLGGPNLIPLQHLADALGVKLVPVAADWDNIVAGLQAGRYDVAANLDSTLERAKAIQFSDPVYEYQGVFVVKADSPYATGQDILDSGKQVATPAGTAPGAAVKAAGATLLELTDYTNALQAVQADRAIAVFADLPTAEAQVQADSSFKIVVPDPAIYAATANYGVPTDIDARSLELINIAIRSANLSGEMERAYAEQSYVTIDQLGDLEKK
jgi:ABC-type amino acid transport substrate-binding protein